MHASRNPACVRMHLRAYIHFERARSARLVVAATRMLDARPPAESMEHPFTTHSPSVSACLCGLPIGIPLVFLSLFLSSQHAFRFLYHPFPLSSPVSLYFHLFSVNLSPSFISIFFQCAVSIFDLILKRSPWIFLFPKNLNPFLSPLSFCLPISSIFLHLSFPRATHARCRIGPSFVLSSKRIAHSPSLSLASFLFFVRDRKRQKERKGRKICYISLYLPSSPSRSLLLPMLNFTLSLYVRSQSVRPDKVQIRVSR